MSSALQPRQRPLLGRTILADTSAFIFRLMGPSLLSLHKDQPSLMKTSMNALCSLWLSQKELVCGHQLLTKSLSCVWLYG